MKIFPGQVDKTQRDQHDGERIDSHQHRDRKLQNERETGIADHHADDRKYHGPAAVSELGEESGEIVRAAGNQPHAGIEACNKEDEPKYESLDIGYHTWTFKIRVLDKNGEDILKQEDGVKK